MKPAPPEGQGQQTTTAVLNTRTGRLLPELRDAADGYGPCEQRVDRALVLSTRSGVKGTYEVLLQQTLIAEVAQASPGIGGLFVVPATIDLLARSRGWLSPARQQFEEVGPRTPRRP